MPFHQPFPRSMTMESIRAHAPVVSGLFGVSNAREWLYIGETDNIQDGLIDVLDKLQAPASTGERCGFVFEICDRAHRVARVDRLILEYEPSFNRNWSRRMQLP